MIAGRCLLRNLGIVVTLFLYLHSAPVSAKTTADFCEEICTLDAACDTECDVAPPELPIFTTDCGTYSDGQCGNTCNLVCTPEEFGSTECNGPEGEPSTCGDYGVYLHCGDDYCARTYESCGNCSADCLCTSATTLPATGFDPTDLDDLCGAASTGGSDLPCPLSIPAGTSCASKDDKVEALRQLSQVLDVVTYWYELAKALCSCSNYDSQLDDLYSARFALTGAMLTVMGSHCFPNG